MELSFCADIVNQIVDAIEQGNRHLVFWGLNANCIYIMSELRKLGILEPYASGIVDSAAGTHGDKVQGFTVCRPEEISKLEVDVLVVTSDRDKEVALREFAAVDSRAPRVILSGTAHFEFRDPIFDALVASCLVKSYANGYENSLIHIYQSIRYLAENNIKGEVAEFGIFKGGTIVFIAKALHHFGFAGTRVFGFDIFEGFPSRRSLLDLYSNPDCEFHEFDAVRAHCEQYGIEVIKGDICETYRMIEGVPLMLSFFDTDNYSPTRIALEACFEQTVKGGVFAFDHYISQDRFLYTIGERMAAREVLKDKRVFHLHGTGIFVKC